jgi:hypothetical protein
MTDPMTTDASAFVQGKVVPVTYCVGPKDDSMITATQHLEASPKPSYGPLKASERYLDDEDWSEVRKLTYILDTTLNLSALDTLEALETLRTHLRKKYYGG